MRSIFAAAALAMLLLLCGCASAKKSYGKGADAEAEGRWATAAEQYIDALRRDPEYPGARERAYEAGSYAVAEYLDIAHRFEAAQRFESALGEYQKADRMVALAASVRVVIGLPGDYAQRKAMTLGRAVDEAMIAVDRLADDGRWREAFDAYRDLLRRLPMGPAQVQQVRLAQLDALLDGAEEALAAGRYDAATEIAADAIDLFGTDAPQSGPALELLARIDRRHYDDLVASARAQMTAGRFQAADRLACRAIAIYRAESASSLQARELRERIIAQGTVVLASMPACVRSGLEAGAPAALAAAIDDQLEQAFWAEPPLFIDVADPDDVRRELRRLDYAGQEITPTRARAVVETLTGDFAAIFTITRCETAALGEPQAHEVMRRDGDSAHITVHARRGIRARCAYKLIDVTSGAVIDEGAAEASAERRQAFATYDGDLDDLLLTRAQHEWFDERAQREIDDALRREIAASLADQIGGAVLGALLEHLP